MEKYPKFERYGKLNKLLEGGGKAAAGLEKTLKGESKSLKNLKADKPDKVDKLNRYVEKIEKNEKSDKTDQLASPRRRRKIFHLKSSKKEKESTAVAAPIREKTKEPPLKGLGKGLLSKKECKESTNNLDVAKEILNESFKSLSKKELKEKKESKAKIPANEVHKNTKITTGFPKDGLLREHHRVQARIAQQGNLSVENQQGSSKENTQRSSPKGSQKDMAAAKSIKDLIDKSLKFKDKDRVRDVGKVKEVRKDFRKSILGDTERPFGKESKTKNQKITGKDLNKESVGVLNRIRKNSPAKGLVSKFVNNEISATNSIFAAPMHLNTGKSAAKLPKVSTATLEHLTDDFLLEDIMTNDDEKKESGGGGGVLGVGSGASSPTKSKQQVASCSIATGRSNQNMVCLPPPPVNNLQQGFRKSSTMTQGKMLTLESPRQKNELQRFFDPIKELCINIPEINEMFNIHQLIGYGAFSTVLLATLKRESKSPFEKRTKFAVKHLSPNNSPKRIKKEMQFMTKIGGSNNVVKLHCCSRHHDSVAFVMPYLECDHFKYYFRLMEPAEVQSYMQNLLIALRHVHKFNVIHRDVKPGNFLYNRVLRKFMLVDFGLAEEVIDLSNEESMFGERDHEVKKHASRAGTRGFRPPEVLLRYTNQTTAVDIWAAGVIFLSILSKIYPPFKPPNDQWAMKEIIAIFGDKPVVKAAKRLHCPIPAVETCKPLDLRKICVHFRNLCKNPAVNKPADSYNFDYADKKCRNCRQCVYNCLCQIPKSQSNDSNVAFDCYPQSAYDLLEKLLDVNPFERITADEALKHPFFKEHFSRSEVLHNNFYMPIRGSLMQILRKN